MKKAYKYIFTISLAALSFSMGAAAQDFQTGYFLGGYNHAFRLNPAFQSERSQMSFLTGDIGVGSRSDLGLSTFLFPRDGQLVTGLSPKVTSEEFLGGFTDAMNPLGAYANVDIFTLGFWANRSYITFDTRLRSDIEMVFPTSLFEFLKDGSSKKTEFDLAGLNANANAILEMAVGYSRRIGDKLSVGGRLKFLEGVAHASITMDKALIKLNQDKWVLEAQGVLDAAISSAGLDVDEKGYFDYESLSDNLKEADMSQPAGKGFAVDLGVTYDILPWITASAAILDLGVMNWNHTIYGVSPTSYTWDPKDKQIDLLDSDSMDGFVDDEIDDLKEAMENILKFKPAKADGVKSKLPLRLNAGVEVRLPFYDRLSLGALYSMKTSDIYKWNEVRLSLNWTPVKFVSLSGSTGLSNFGESFGAALNFHPRVLNFFVGADFIPKTIAALPKIGDTALPSFIGLPVEKLNANIYMGLSIAIGRTRIDHTRNLILAETKSEELTEDPFPLEEPSVSETKAPETVPQPVEEPALEGEEVAVDRS